MIFGFNTDIKHGDIVYHVQSEFRQNERAVETQVFVRGRCIGKQAVPLGEPEPDEAAVHETLKAQHRNVVEMIRAGNLEALFGPPDSRVAAEAMKVEWVEAQAAPDTNVMRLVFRITSSGQPAAARVVARVEIAGQSPTFVEGKSGIDGLVELSVPANHGGADAAFVVQASDGARTTTQRFRMRRK